MEKRHSFLGRVVPIWILLLMCVPCVGQRVTLPKQQLTLKMAMSLIKKQTGFDFFYNDQQIDINRIVYISGKNMPLAKVLDNLFKDSQTTYQIEGKTIVLAVHKIESNRSASNLQDTKSNDAKLGKKITGHITDQNGEPIIGATIREAGTENVTITNVEGIFQMIVNNPTATLKISYVGFDEMEIKLGDRADISVVMSETNSTLNEVIVVGYGTQKKVNLSGAVDQVNAADLEKRPISDLSKGLQGMVPNLNIDFTSGEPGQAASVNIRGVASINGGEPLLLIDGIPSDMDEMNRLLSEDIESISVLKDAASAAIYGARASFGVILITTKKGDENRIKISYNNHLTWKRPSQLTNKTSDPFIYLKLKNIAVLNTPWSAGFVTDDEHLEWARQKSDDPTTESIRLNPQNPSQWEYMGATDWTRHFLDHFSFSQAHEASVSGASEKANYYLSLGYNGENGMLNRLAKDNYTRYNTRIKIGYMPWTWLTIGNNTSLEIVKRKKPYYYTYCLSQEAGSANINLYDAEPWHMDKNPDGTWANTKLGECLAQLVDGGRDNDEYDKVQSTLSVESRFFRKALRVNANFTFAKIWDKRNTYQTPYSIGYGPDDFRTFGASSATDYNASTLYTVFDVYGSFAKTLGNHFINAIAGFNQEYYRWERSSMQRYDLLSQELPSIGLASGDIYITDKYKDWAIRGLYYRLNYIYRDKYIVEIDGRYDGTSRFPKKKRFGFFPSASLAWRVSQENFFKPLEVVIDNLKLRASYGSLGNQLVSEYGYVPYLNSQLGTYIIDGKLQQTVISPGLVSPNYTWEKVKMLNFGVDLGFFGSSLTASFDIYRRDTNGMLTLGKELPRVIGATEPMENAANMRTKGWEFSIGYNGRTRVADKPLTWHAKFSLADNTSKITKFDNPDKNLGQYYVGQTLGEIWGLKSDGFFKTQDEIRALDETQIIPWGALAIVEGWPKYKDLDGDHKITKGTTVNRPGDLSIIGNSSPRYRFGLNVGGEWMGFDVSFFFQGIGKRDYYPLSYLYWSFYQQPYTGGQVSAFDYYRATGESAEDRAKDSHSWIAAGLADENRRAKYPVFQAWLADRHQGMGANGMGLAIPQTEYMLNGAYLRMKNITIGYTLPALLTKKIGISKLRVYLSGDNLFEFSELKKHFDPEAVTQEGNFGYVYPFNRQYTIGVNLTF
jgi:TonB-linked SusC/RagA family outer membrane protein